MWEARAGDDPEIAAHVRTARPDVICIAGYPWLLRGEIIASPPALTLNVHAALLPRHRGPLPLFWIYHQDDRETGVTVHAVTDRADAGDIFDQERFPLPRGFPVEQLNRQNAEPRCPAPAPGVVRGRGGEGRTEAAGRGCDARHHGSGRGAG